jgi:hypothetical protein
MMVMPDGSIQTQKKRRVQERLTPLLSSDIVVSDTFEIFFVNDQLKLSC